MPTHSAPIGSQLRRDGTRFSSPTNIVVAMLPTAAVRAVFVTLARATADARTPVVLRSRSADQARDLALWLSRVHGSQRTVIASATACGLIELRLPSRLDWQAVPHEELVRPLAALVADPHLSRMAHFTPPGGTR